MRVPGPLVPPAWLHAHLRFSVRIVDASLYMPAEKRLPRAEFQSRRIPGAQFFDLDACSGESAFPHMLPTVPQFTQCARSLGVSAGSPVVVYDGKGIFSAPRLAWTFNVFGHDNVAVLDGGLPAWERAGLPLESGPPSDPPASDPPFQAQPPAATLIASYDDMVSIVSPDSLEAPSRSILDARSGGRFDGTAPEPRPSLPSGHIKGSASLPFLSLLTPSGTFKTQDELRALFLATGSTFYPNGEGLPPIASCGSGVTACIIALASRIAFPHLPPLTVYDGSWSEWAVRTTIPKMDKFATVLRLLSLSLVATPARVHVPDILELYKRVKAYDYTAVKEFVALCSKEGGVIELVRSSPDKEGWMEARVCEIVAKSLTMTALDFSAPPS